MPPVISLPDAIPTLDQAEALTDLYLSQVPSVRQRLAALEQQALFLLLVDTLENPEHGYDQLDLVADGDSIWIQLSHANDSQDSLLLDDESEELGARAMAFMEELPYLNEDHAFVRYLSEHPLTRENTWAMARALLGKEAASALEAANLLQSTSAAPASAPPRPRM